MKRFNIGIRHKDGIGIPGEMVEHPQGEYVRFGDVAAMQEQSGRPVLNGIIEEIHRRADKEWADNGFDFTVTISADEYRALCDEDLAIDRRRIEGES